MEFPERLSTNCTMECTSAREMTIGMLTRLSRGHLDNKVANAATDALPEQTIRTYNVEGKITTTTSPNQTKP